MCGLFGVIRPGGLTSADERALERLGQHLRHRGPDGSGFIKERNALLGMHRLSIMDPAHGWQPFWSEDGRWGVLGNGEIYNATALRQTLVGKGHQLETRSDIEVVPHLMEEYGQEAFVHLRGMFALVVFDRLREQVLLVRDRMGEKPLCYFQGDDALYFSSEQGALVKAGLVPLTIDSSLLPQYLLHGYTPDPYSLIEGVRKVPAAHVLVVDLESARVSERPYWDPTSAVGGLDLTDADIASSLVDAITATCTSDVPVGVALSGGLDSSLVAAVAKNARTDIHAFTVGYSEIGADESSLARDFANHLGIPCHTTILHTNEIAAEFGRICGMRDEPISDIAGPALNALPQAAREAGVPVLLTGIGGDELFWGYDWIRQQAAWMTNLAREYSLGQKVTKARFSQRPASLQAQVDWVLGLGGRRADSQMRAFVAQGNRVGRMPLPFYEFQPGYMYIKHGMTQLVGGYPDAQQAEFWGEPKADHMAAYYTNASNATYLRVNSFVQVDRLAMQHSIESRTPLADADLVATMLSGRLKSHDHLLPPKARLREIALEFLPLEVINRPKRGFTPPVRDWVRAIWRSNHSALTGEASIALADLPATPTRSWIQRPITRGGRINQVAMRLMTLELWLRSLS